MLYFRGCTAREKENSIQESTEKLLKLAGVDYHILDDEKCCGSVLLRTGFNEEAEEQIRKNTEILNWNVKFWNIFYYESIIKHRFSVVNQIFVMSKNYKFW